MYTSVETVLVSQNDPVSGSSSKEVVIRTEEGQLKRRLLCKLFQMGVVTGVQMELLYELAEELAKNFKNTEAAEVEVIDLMVDDRKQYKELIRQLIAPILIRKDIRTVNNSVIRTAKRSRLYRATVVRELLIARKEFLELRKKARRLTVFNQREALANSLWKSLMENRRLKEELNAVRASNNILETEIDEIRLKLAYEQGVNGRLEQELHHRKLF
ncbi:hypothetical protein IJG78_01225 [Candidatus Saccharibacteria bacterium]|nr:hypothetical protein [Candidatus Saccharibacteria bacterium]